MRRRGAPSPKPAYDPIPEWLFVAYLVVAAVAVATLFFAMVKAAW